MAFKENKETRMSCPGYDFLKAATGGKAPDQEI